MNFGHLAVFHAVAIEGSVSKGAERLLVSQPAISKQLKDFERKMGTPLFDRLPRGMRLTEAGALLARYAQRLFAIADEAERMMGELRGLRHGRLSVGASTTIGVYLLPEIFVRFRQVYPGVELNLEIANSEGVQDRLRRGVIDIGLTEIPAEGEDFNSTVFMEDELVAVAPVGHALAQRRSVTPEALCREPFVVRETGSATKSLAERALAERGLTVRPTMSLGNTEAIKRAVASGVGVAIISHLAIGLELRAKRLVKVRVSNLRIRRPLYRISLRGSNERRAVQAFIQMVDEAAHHQGSA